MAVEIERKFLLAKPPQGLDEHPSEAIRQGYLAIAADGTEVRVRDGGGQWLTVKQGAGESRGEVEIELDRRQFETLWPLTEGRRISKRRHRVPAGGVTVDVDVYGGELAGLVTAEVEFGSPEEARSFDPPAWLGEDVTADGRYANQRLATAGTPARAQRAGAD